MLFLDPFKDLLFDYNSCHRQEGLPASQNILDNYQHKALVPQWAWSVLYSWLDSELKGAAFWGQQNILASALFSIGSMLRREAPEAAREETASWPPVWPFYLVSTDHCRTQLRTGQSSLLVTTVSWRSFVCWKSSVYHLTHQHPHHISHFKTPVLRHAITWSLQSFALLHECFQPTEFRLAVRKCGKIDSVTSRQPS